MARKTGAHRAEYRLGLMFWAWIGMLSRCVFKSFSRRDGWARDLNAECHILTDVTDWRFESWPLNVALSKGTDSTQNVWRIKIRSVQQLWKKIHSSELFLLMLKSLISSFSYFVWSTKGKLFFGDAQGGQPQIAFKSSPSLSQFLCQIATSIIMMMSKRCSLVCLDDLTREMTPHCQDNSSSECAPYQHTRFSSGPPALLEPSTNSVLLSLCWSQSTMLSSYNSLCSCK